MRLFFVSSKDVRPRVLFSFFFGSGWLGDSALTLKKRMGLRALYGTGAHGVRHTYRVAFFVGVFGKRNFWRLFCRVTVCELACEIRDVFGGLHAE